MREDRASTTAQLVALARAVYSVAPRPFHAAEDPIARRLLPVPLALFAGALTPLWHTPRVAHALARAIGLGFAEHVALRTAAIDAAVVDALAQGATQVVILGAGLDARAYRMPELRDAVVYEVDHPATQRFKRERLAGVPVRARTLRFVSMDFERQRLRDVLADAGHDAGVSTVWIWEGVTVYLEPRAALDTLDHVAARSTPGSTLIVTYATPQHLAPSPEVGPLVSLVAALGRLVGEPVRWLPSSAELHGAFARTGFRVLSDESTHDWAARFWSGAVADIREWERLVVARKE